MTWFTIIKNATEDAEAFWYEYREKTLNQLVKLQDSMNIDEHEHDEEYTDKERGVIERAKSKLNKLVLNYMIAFDAIEKKPLEERLIWLRDTFSPSQNIWSLFGIDDKDHVLDREELNKHIDKLKEWRNYWS